MIQPHIRVPLSLLRYFPLLILRIPLCQNTIYCSTVCMYLAVVLDNSRPMAGRMVYISGFGSMLQLKKRVAPVQVRFPKTEMKLGCSSDLSNIA